MKVLFTFLTIFTALVTGFENVKAEENLFNSNKSDTAIKPFVFPKSMVVIRSCHGADLLAGHFGSFHNLCTQPDQLLDRKTIKKFLAKLDPARIAPATIGKDYQEMVSRIALKALKNMYGADFLFVFRQAKYDREDGLLMTQGLIYLTQQDKLLVIPSNIETDSTGHKGLQKLAKDARKVIMSHKYEKRRSNY